MNASSACEKTVLITGAAGGLGRALVQRFFEAGWRIVAASHSAAEWPGELRVTPVVLDVTQPDNAARIIKEHGPINCLIQNAGIIRDALSWQMDEGDWDAALNTNLKGAFNCARAVARQMIGQGDGHIIHVSSYGGRAGAAGQANYAAAKAGLIGLTQSLARELGSRNVRVNAVLPGVLPTKMTANLPPARLEDFARANALGRINSLDEVARFIVFLSTTQNISGQVFQLDSRIAPWT